MDLDGKLQIKPGQSIAILHCPTGLLLPLEVTATDPNEADVLIGFAVMRADLAHLEPAMAAAREDRLTWICYPKARQLNTDLNRDSLAHTLSAHGIQPVRQVSINDIWSALRFRPATM